MLPAHADWGRRAPIWDTDGGGSNRIALFPPLPRAATPPHPTSPHPSPLGFSGPPVAIHRQREFSGKGGGGSGPLLGDLLLGERWLSYLERKTEVEAGATVAWAWTLAPLPLLGAHIQTAAIGSALTVFCVGFGTRPRGKQREFLLRREAARCFQPTRIGMESLKGRTGGRDGGLPELCFRQCQAPGPAVLWSLSQGRGSVERALAGRPSGSASERAASFEILWRRALCKKSREGRVSEHTGEDWTAEPKRAPPVPEQSREPGDGCAFGSHLATPRQPG